MFAKRVLLFLTLVSPAVVLSSLAAGCGANSSWTFDSDNHSNQTIGTRSFLVHIPANYDPSSPHAVVLSFHGRGASDKVQETITGLSKPGLLIANKGIIAVYPMGAFGTGKHKKPSRAWKGAPYASKEVDDFAFVDDMLDAVKSNLCVDPARVYASGMSNGGGFVNLLACSADMAPKFAAFAPVSAALYSGTHPFTSCDPGRAVPIINFHGSADKTIPFLGRNVTDTADRTPAIPDWREGWVTRNGCDPTAPSNVTTPYDGVVETTWECGGDNRTEFKAFQISNGVHRWPTTAETSFDATPDQIVPFFDRFTIPYAV